MRKNQIFALLLTFFFIGVAGVSMTNFGAANVNDSASPGMKWDVEKLDGTAKAETITPDDCHKPCDVPDDDDDTPPDVIEPGTITEGGETVSHLVIDDTGTHPGGAYYQEFTCIYKGVYGNIWIGLNEAFDWHDENDPNTFDDDVWYFSYPWTPTGIPDDSYPENDGYYLKPGYIDVVTAQDLKEVLMEFDNNIHDTDTSYFGDYKSRPGYLDDYKVQVFVFNIWDDFFFDPINAPGFIEGYFWSYIANNYDTNAFHMDTYQWFRRQGGNPPMEAVNYNGDLVDYSYLSPHPWEYEGTFAHEFQHLIHYDVDSNELSWVNEGCSTLAEVLCGYGFSPGHISQYLIYFWDTSLVVWEQYLSNYGAVFLWTFYMYEHYGFDTYYSHHGHNKQTIYNGLIWDLVHEQANGIEGWNNVLAAHHIKKSFDQIFQDWMIANYLDDTSKYGGIYGYFGLDLPSADSSYYSIPFVMEMWAGNYPQYFDWIVTKYPHEGANYPLGLSRNLPYMADYVQFYKLGSQKTMKVTFDGEDYAGAAPTSGEYNWYSDGTAWSWFRLSHEFDFTGVSGPITLTFQNYYSIEQDYDYGYVEVYTYEDGWTTLPGLSGLTTDELPYVQDNPNCPDDVEPSAYAAAGKWNAFTGNSPGMYQEVMDLSAYAGKKITLSFTYWTDPYTLGSGWYIDDIGVQGTGYSYLSDVETVDSTWMVNAGWERNNKVIPNDFTVNFINIYNSFTKKGDLKYTWYYTDSMRINTNTETGYYTTSLYDQNHVQKYTIMAIANQPGYEHTFGSSYYFKAEILKHHHWYCF